MIALLTCSSAREATAIAGALLRQRLIACAKKLPVTSRFRWQGKLHVAREVILLLETSKERFADIERAVKKLHAHKVFVLMAVPVSRVSAGVRAWLTDSLR